MVSEVLSTTSCVRKTKSLLQQGRDNAGSLGAPGHLTLDVYLVYVALPEGRFVLLKYLNNFFTTKNNASGIPSENRTSINFCIY